MLDQLKRADEVEVFPASERDLALNAQREPSGAEASSPTKVANLKASRDAVVDAASVSAGLWLSYLLAFFYLAIAAGGVTHRNLFFETPVKLPFLNVDLPLKAFFVLGPLLFLIVHAYVLLHFALLSGKIGAFDAELGQMDDEDARARIRRQLPINIFVQLLAGPRETRTHVMGFMLRLIAWITLVIGPIALLVLFQLQFLAYHNQPITWWHRVAVIVDLVLLWMLWPSVVRGGATWITWRDLRRGMVMMAALMSLLPALLVVTIATFPDEWLDKYVPSVPFVPTEWPSFKTVERHIPAVKQEGDEDIANGGPRTIKEVWSVVSVWKSMKTMSLHMLLVVGDVDEIARKPTSLWSNRLVLPQIDAVDPAKFGTEAKIAAAPVTLSLRGRRLEGAVLIGADLRKVDFTAAQLQGASLNNAQLQDASFKDARLEGASLSEARLQGASLSEARLQGASLRKAQLQGAFLDYAQLQGGDLWGAQLQGADLWAAQLQGAELNTAKLQGASLDKAHLQGADLTGANLQGASLDGAQLQGADLGGAELQGASLHCTQLQGASLREAQLQGASLHFAFVWRADAEGATAEGARVFEPETSAKYGGFDCHAEEWSAKTFIALQEEIKKLVPEVRPFSRDTLALRRIATLGPAYQVDEKSIAKRWGELARSSPSDEVYPKVYLKTLGEIGCSEDGAPYVAHKLIENLSLDEDLSKLPEAAALARAFLDENRCPGVRDLSEKDKAMLREIRDTASAPPHRHPRAPRLRRQEQ